MTDDLMMNTDAEVRAGVRDSWDYWLSQHPVSVPVLIESAVRAAVFEWLTEHGATLRLEE